MSFQNQRIDTSLLLRWLPYGYCTGNVCSSAVVMCTTVQQEQAVFNNLRIGFLRSLVMHYSAMSGKTGNSLETQQQESFLFSTQGRQFPVHPKFRHLLPSIYCLLQSCEEAHHSHTVTHMSLTETVLLNHVLHGFPQRYRCFRIVAGKFLIVWGYAYSQSAQIVLDAGDLLLIHIHDMIAVCRHIQEGYHKGIIGNVTASYVQQPCHFREVGHINTGETVLRKVADQPLQFLLGRLACRPVIHYPGLCAG